MPRAQSRGGNGKSAGQKAKPKPTARGSVKNGGGYVQQPQPHVGVPTWIVPIVVNVVVLVAGIAGTWFTMQGDIGSLKTQMNGMNATINAQIARIDGMVKEQDRITRLEERLGNITGLLQEIRADLRDGRYAVRRDGVITTNPPGRN